MTFAERLKELRISRNLTQKQVYEAVQMSPLGYQRYEYGDREPAYGKLLALADYFNVPLDFLCGRGVFANWDEYAPHMPALLDSMAFLLEVPASQLSELSMSEIVSLISVMYSRIEYDAASNSLSVHPLVSPADILKSLHSDA